jgi:monoamine oxidase
VAVVGAGLAGLVTAHMLQTAGCSSQLFEASDRIGGRIRTDFGSQEPGLVTEWGAEFIDSTHHDMLALVQWCGLSLLDTATESEAELRTAYHFQGGHYSEAQVLEAYAPVAARIASDAARLTPALSRVQHSPADIALDRVSITEYLDRMEMEPWLRSLLCVAYETELGRDAGELSCIGLLSQIGTDLSKGFKIFGESDERFKVAEGLELIPRRLAEGLTTQPRMRHRLVQIRQLGEAYRLSFETDGGSRQFDADAVVLALPFTLLRQVDLGELLPPIQRHCVQTLDYGLNSKLMVGLRSRPWRRQGFDGGLYTDLPMQTGWDASRQRNGERGIFTWYMGGKQSLAIDRNLTKNLAQRMSQAMEPVFAGFCAERTGTATLIHWPTEPFALGSYSCYRTGQYTALGGLEARGVGGLHFAGEHCSREFQGYMNGAAETGRRAALQIVARCS